MTLTRPRAPRAGSKRSPARRGRCRAPLERGQRLARAAHLGDPLRRRDDGAPAGPGWRSCDDLRLRTRAPCASSVARRRAGVDGRRRLRRCRRATEAARPATNSAAPALSSTTSRGAPRCAVAAHAATIAAFSAASPPSRSAGDRLRAGRRPPDARRRCAPRRRGTPTPWCARWSRARRCRRRRAPPTRASEPSSSSARASSSVSSGARHADDLPRRAGRIGQRSEQVEGGADAELAPRRARMPHRRDGTSARRRTRCSPRAACARRRPARRRR